MSILWNLSKGRRKKTARSEKEFWAMSTTEEFECLTGLNPWPFRRVLSTEEKWFSETIEKKNITKQKRELWTVKILQFRSFVILQWVHAKTSPSHAVWAVGRSEQKEIWSALRACYEPGWPGWTRSRPLTISFVKIPMCSYENRASPVNRDLGLGDRDLAGWPIWICFNCAWLNGPGSSILPCLLHFPFQLVYHLTAVIRLRKLAKLRPEARSKQVHVAPSFILQAPGAFFISDSEISHMNTRPGWPGYMKRALFDNQKQTRRLWIAKAAQLRFKNHHARSLGAPPLCSVLVRPRTRQGAPHFILTNIHE